MLSILASAEGVPRPYLFGCGYTPSHWIGRPPDYDIQCVDRLVEIGATFTSGPGAWVDLESSPGVWDWTNADRMVDIAVSRGLTSFGFVGTTPYWALPEELQDNPTAYYRYPPSEEYADAFMNYCRTMAARYAGKVDHWTFWNEPNGCAWVREGCNNMDGYPLYVHWLKRAYTALKEGNPNCKVGAGNLDYHEGVPGYEYIEGMYSEGAKGYFDAINIHIYADEEIYWQGIQETRQTMVANGDGDKGIWLGEYGWYNTLAPEAPGMLESVLTRLSSEEFSYVGMANYLILNDLPNHSGVSYGLCDRDLNPRPIMYAFQNFPKPTIPSPTPSEAATATPSPTGSTPTPTPTVSDGNLVKNPGAETGDWSFWNRVGEPQSAWRIDPDPHLPDPPNHSGTHHFGISVNGAPAELRQYQEIGVTPGHTYQAGFYVWKEDGTQEAVRLAWIDGPYGGQEMLLFDTGMNRINWWGHASGLRLTPSSDRITLILIYVHDDSSGIASIHVDDIYLRDEAHQTPTPTPTVPEEPAPKSGYSATNFSISGEIATSGQCLARVYYNPPIQDRWLHHIGSGQFVVRNEDNGVVLRDRDCLSRQVTRNWPFNTLVLEDPRLENTRIEISCFAPAAYDDIERTSIPAVMAEVSVENRATSPTDLTLYFEFDSDPSFSPGTHSIRTAADHYALASDRFGLAFDRPAGYTPPSSPEGTYRLSRRITLAGEGEVEARFLFLLHAEQGYYASQWPTWDSLASYIYSDWGSLRDMTEDVDSRLPRIGDSQLEEYMRWYATAGVALTKVHAPDTVLTMGYTQLNQRDSFWTSWIHLFLWPSADRRMIEETAEHQRPDGKIPTTILPVIERNTDIDINEYYILRVFRHYDWTRDESFLVQQWPYVKNAVEYLVERDTDGDDLPDPVDSSYWADWKDVPPFADRKYGPHFCLLWVAVLQKAAETAERVGDTDASADYALRALRASERVNAPRSGASGGLWTGNFYANLWKNGLFDPDNRVLQDQAVGGVFGAIPEARVSSVFDAISANLAPWGVRETYPYYPDDFLPDPGIYHNGAVWPWLNFADAFARYRYGYPSQAEGILKAVGYYDLEREGDYLPHENLNGDSGENDWGHHEIQGWNACFVGTLYFGALGVERPSLDRLCLYPRLPEERSFQTRLSLREGTIEWEQFTRNGNTCATLTSSLSRPMVIEYGFRISDLSTPPSANETTIGSCHFRVFEITLHEGGEAQLCREGFAPWLLVD